MKNRGPAPKPSSTGKIQAIAVLLRKTYSGEAWHGPSVLQALAGLTATEASAHPLSGAHSIWELVLHITFWKDTVRRRLEGEPIGDVRSDENWPRVTETTPERWQRALKELDAAHRRLLSAVERLDEGRLVQTLPGEAGRVYTVYETLHGVLQHDAYHAGQISVLRKGPRRD